MLDGIFSLFIEVIRAARDGRYMESDGQHWFIVTPSGKKVCINTLNGTVVPVPNYDGQAKASMDQYYKLITFLMLEKADDQVDSAIAFNADVEISNARKDGRIMHTNGAQTHIKRNDNLVEWYDFSSRAVTRNVMSRHRSFKYLQEAGCSFNDSIGVFSHPLVA